MAEEVLRQIRECRIEQSNNRTIKQSRIVYKPLPGDDPKKRKPDITLAKKLLGWEPRVPLAEGLAKTIAYFESKVGKARK